jgi:hypothetical protein
MDASGENLVEHIAGVEDHLVAQATYRAAVERWPGAAITLHQGARVKPRARGVSPSTAQLCGSRTVLMETAGERAPLQSSSASRFIAGASEFLNLSPSREWPELARVSLASDLYPALYVE